MKSLVSLAFCAMLAWGDETADRVKRVITTECTDAECRSKQDIQFAKDHRDIAIPILLEKLSQEHLNVASRLAMQWLGFLGPYKDSVVADSLFKLTNNPDEVISGTAWRSLARLAGTGDHSAKEIVQEKLSFLTNILFELKGTKDPDLKLVLLSIKKQLP
jgi:hypothetical protein